MAPRGKSLLDSFGVKLTPPAAFFESPAHSSLAAIQQSQPPVAKQPLPFLKQAHHENSSNEAVRATGGQRGFLFDRIPAPMVDLEEDSTSLDTATLSRPLRAWGSVKVSFNHRVVIVTCKKYTRRPDIPCDMQY